MISLSILPERVRPFDERVLVEHNGLCVGNLARDVGGKVVAYHDYSDALGGDGTIPGALAWLRGAVGKHWGITVPEPVAITESGVYDLAAAVYHADPVPEGSLSQSAAKKLLDEGGAAKFHHATHSEKETKPEWDLGSAAHALVLGKGAEQLVEINADDWRTKAAKAARDKAHADGKTPLLPKQMRVAEDMAAELAKHTRAMEVLSGEPEVSMFYRRDDGLWLRGQMDAKNPECTGDYKTTTDASSYGFTRSVWKFRYYLQAAWYRRMRGWLTGDWLPFRLAAQETTAPYLVSVWEASPDYIELGEADMDDAIALYERCVETGQWPGYPDEIQMLHPPAWAQVTDNSELSPDVEAEFARLAGITN